MQHVLVVRHAIAEDRQEAARAGVSDSRRALTDKGIRRMRETAAGLAQVTETPQRILHSPLRRAVQTAELLAAPFPRAALEETAALVPGADNAAVDRALRYAGSRDLAIVGHEPDLGAWVAHAVFGSDRSAVPLKKAGAALVVFADAAEAGAGELQWLLPPRISRRLGSTA